MTGTEGLYVYAVTRGVPGAGGTGIDGVPLEVVSVGEGLSAVVHHHTGAPYTGLDDDVRRWVVEHSEVIDRIWEAGFTILPMTFNVIVADGGEQPARRRLESWLAANAEALLARLDVLEAASSSGSRSGSTSRRSEVTTCGPTSSARGSRTVQRAFSDFCASGSRGSSATWRPHSLTTSTRSTADGSPKSPKTSRRTAALASTPASPQCSASRCSSRGTTQRRSASS